MAYYDYVEKRVCINEYEERILSEEMAKHRGKAINYHSLEDIKLCLLSLFLGEFKVPREYVPSFDIKALGNTIKIDLVPSISVVYTKQSGYLSQAVDDMDYEIAIKKIMEYPIAKVLEDLEIVETSLVKDAIKYLLFNNYKNGKELKEVVKKVKAYKKIRQNAELIRDVALIDVIDEHDWDLQDEGMNKILDLLL